jgi:hypothetical protein
MNPKDETAEKITSEIRDGVYQSYLISSTGLDPMIISKICDTLEIKGLIVRKQTSRTEENSFRIKPANLADFDLMAELISKLLTDQQ